MENEVKHTAHSSYRREYHIVFASKYRREVIYKQLRKDIGEIFRKLCKEMKVEIIEAEACVDHIHMLVSIPSHMSIAQFVGTIKSKSALMCGGILISIWMWSGQASASMIVTLFICPYIAIRRYFDANTT